MYNLKLQRGQSFCVTGFSKYHSSCTCIIYHKCLKNLKCKTRFVKKKMENI